MKRLARIPLSLVLALLLGGCAMLDPGPPVPRILLPVRTETAKEADRMPVQLLVSHPVTDTALQSDRILALMNGYEIRAFDSARWAASISWMVQRLLVDSLEDTRRFAAVGSEESIMDGSIRLSTEVRRFYLRYEDGEPAPTADIAIILTLADPHARATFARAVFSARERCAGNSLHDFVAAFATAMSRILEESNEWVTRSVADHLGAVSGK